MSTPIPGKPPKPPRRSVKDEAIALLKAVTRNQRLVDKNNMRFGTDYSEAVYDRVRALLRRVEGPEG